MISKGCRGYLHQCKLGRSRRRRTLAWAHHAEMWKCGIYTQFIGNLNGGNGMKWRYIHPTCGYLSWSSWIGKMMMHQWMEWGPPFLRNHHLRSSKGVIAKEETLEMTGLSRAFSKRQRPTSNCLASGGCKVSTRKWPNVNDDFYGLWYNPNI